ncbi:MAG: putative selenium-dependent hydroxylase accessory protein YqeC, partial [Streblomastix strix]
MLNSLFEKLQFGKGDVVALVGGGGKTTIMQKLANYLCVERKMKVIMTTTTNISSEQSLGTKVFNPEMDLDICMKQIQDAFLSKDDNIGHIVTVGKQEGKKLSGINNEWISHLLSICDIIIVEADGASRKPLKACAFYEPVIPDSTSVVISVVGADCVGFELNDNFVHRSQIMKDEILNINSDEPKRIILTAEDVVSVVLSSNGHIKGCLLAQGKINKGSLPEFLTCQGILSSN